MLKKYFVVHFKIFPINISLCILLVFHKLVYLPCNICSQIVCFFLCVEENNGSTHLQLSINTTIGQLICFFSLLIYIILCMILLNSQWRHQIHSSNAGSEISNLFSNQLEKSRTKYINDAIPALLWVQLSDWSR